jgi:dienelactone hydrolase
MRIWIAWIVALMAGLVIGCGGGGEAVDAGHDGGQQDATDGSADADAATEDGGQDAGDAEADDGGPEDGGQDDGDTDPGDTDPGDGDSLPSDNGLDGGDQTSDYDPGEFCWRATACVLGQTCNLCTGACEAQAQVPGEVAEILTAYPLAGAPGDFLMIEGEGFYSTLLPDFTASLTIGSDSFNSFQMGYDENRMMVVRTPNTNGSMSYTAQSGSSQHPGPVVTDSSYAVPQACGPNDPPASGTAAGLAAEAGPYAPGFADLASPWPLRVHYPAECGGLRKPLAQGAFPVVLILHGDGAIGINYDFLARHLASWGFLVVTPNIEDAANLRLILAAALDDPAQLYGPLAGASAGGQAVVVGHSMGSTRTGDMFSLGEDRIGAVIFLGPVSQTINYPVPGVVFGATGDMQSLSGTYENIFEALQKPRWLAVVQGGNHSQFTDAKHWEGWAFSDQVPEITRNRQFELVQSLSLAFLQRHFGQTELFDFWLSDPGIPDEIVLTVELP